MYPAHFFSLFPPFPREQVAFVAMSFDPRFDARWTDVIAPAIKRIHTGGKCLQPRRLDTRSISDSILTEILSGIANSLVVFADITTIGHLDETPIRSGNVMYEVGIAQAVRLPEEVILFRSDSDRLLFDMSNVRVNSYSPDTAPEKAREAVANTILEALRELDLRRHLAVQKVAEMLDFPSWSLLTEALRPEGISYPKMKSMGAVIGSASRAAAISRLLEMGALRTKYDELTPELFAQFGDTPNFDPLKYECTALGAAVLKEAATRMGLFSPEILKVVEERLSASGSKELPTPSLES